MKIKYPANMKRLDKFGIIRAANNNIKHNYKENV